MVLGGLGASGGVLGRLGASWGRLGGVLEASWGHLGTVLGASWAILGRLDAFLRRSRGAMGRLRGVLEASWRGLAGLLGGLGPRKVANMVPSWPPKRSQNQLKIDPKIDQFFSASRNRFLEGFCWILDAKMKQS